MLFSRFLHPSHFRLMGKCRPLFTKSNGPLQGNQGKKKGSRWVLSICNQLTPEERTYLLEELVRRNEGSPGAQQLQTPPLTTKQLRLVLFAHSLPFIGFGFLDNAIMIVAGEYIDLSFGAFLGISTMAAAALGNLVSDLFGIGSVGYVEILAVKFGVAPPPLSPEQLNLQSTRWASALGRALGITIGCLLGMLPLLFYDFELRNKEEIPEERSK